MKSSECFSTIRNVIFLSKVTNWSSQILTRSDVGGDLALHHGVKQSDTQSVKLLLSTEKKKSLFQENFVGLTPVDCAMEKLIGRLYIDRKSRRSSVNPGILDLLTPTQLHKRVLATGEDVSKAW